MTDTVTINNSWFIYRGSGERSDRIAALPPAPQWRQFDGEILPDEPPAGAEPLAIVDPRPGAEARARAYQPEPAVVEKANAAIYLRRPLLVTGQPGTGKSTLAQSIAWELKLGAVLYWPITSRSQLNDGLYRYDALGRLQDANMRRLDPQAPAAGPLGRFITLGPLGTALVARERPRVLLIDEFDKGDIDLPNDLLHVLEEGQFTVPELVREGSDEITQLITEEGSTVAIRGGIVRCNAFPIVIITSNGERTFPAAFLRRCISATIREPDEKKLVSIVKAQIGASALDGNDAVLQDFLERRVVDGGIPTDHLLNAMYLANAALTHDAEGRRNAARGLYGPGASGDL